MFSEAQCRRPAQPSETSSRETQSTEAPKNNQKESETHKPKLSPDSPATKPVHAPHEDITEELFGEEYTPLEKPSSKEQDPFADREETNIFTEPQEEQPEYPFANQKTSPITYQPIISQDYSCTKPQPIEKKPQEETQQKHSLLNRLKQIWGANGTPTGTTGSWTQGEPMGPLGIQELEHSVFGTPPSGDRV